MTFGKVIKEYRDSHGLSQQDFADLSAGRLTRFSIGRAEQIPSYNPRPSTLKAMADVMNMSIDELVRRATNGDEVQQ